MTATQGSSSPPEPGGSSPTEFGARLEALFLTHRDLIYDSLADEAFRRLQGSMSRTAVEHVTGIHRGRISEFFAGSALPREDELLVMLRALRFEQSRVHPWVSVLRRIASGTSEPPAVERYDAQKDGLFMKAVWNDRKRATRETFVIDRVEPPTQGWIQPERLSHAGADGSGAEIPYFVRIDADHGESFDTEVCRLQLATGTYASARAINRLRVTEPNELAEADSQLATNLDGYLSHAVPTSVNINVVPVTSDNLAICVRRSAGVESAQGCWTVGIVETMKNSDRDLHDLAMRALRAELGAEASDVLEVHISWLGFYRPVLRGHLVAVARLANNADAAIREATGPTVLERYEAAAFDAVDPYELWAELADAPTVLSNVDAHPLLVAPERNWVDHSRLAAAETLRYLHPG